MNKLETINKIFDGYNIRSVWDSVTEDYYFSVVDVIGALTNGKRDRKYWNDLKKQLKNICKRERSRPLKAVFAVCIFGTRPGNHRACNTPYSRTS